MRERERERERFLRLLTAHNSIDKNGYCAIWDEKTCGRTANDVSSALYIIVEKIVSKYQNINNMTYRVTVVLRKIKIQ